MGILVNLTEMKPRFPKKYIESQRNLHLKTKFQKVSNPFIWNLSRGQMGGAGFGCESLVRIYEEGSAADDAFVLPKNPIKIPSDFGGRIAKSKKTGI